MSSTANSNWGVKPSRKAAQPQGRDAAIDAFVNSGKGAAPPLKRLNANIPASLHARIKAQCALEGRDMTEVLVEVLEARFPVGSNK